MLCTRTWSAPLLGPTFPNSFQVKDTSSANIYDLQGCTCAEGSKQRQLIDFQYSYSPIASIGSIQNLLAVATSKHYTPHVLDISIAFQNSIMFDPSECTYVTLPPFCLTRFKSKWPDYKLPSTTPSLLALQCLKAIQSTKDADLCLYHLLSGHLHEFGMTIFTLTYNSKLTILVLETDDILVACNDNDPFLHIKSDIETFFDVTSSVNSIL
jgi:hypothetical protein